MVVYSRSLERNINTEQVYHGPRLDIVSVSDKQNGQGLPKSHVVMLCLKTLPAAVVVRLSVKKKEAYLEQPKTDQQKPVTLLSLRPQLYFPCST